MKLKGINTPLILVLCIALACSFSVISHANAREVMTIGTASVTGVYFPTGGAICRLFNTKIKEHGIKCSVEVTGGSIDNLEALKEGNVSLGIVQSDWQYNAYHGKGGFLSKGGYDELRSVFSLYSEPFTVITRTDSNIHKFRDLKGKRVNFGNRGSGMRATMEMVMQAYDWKWDDFAKISAIKTQDQSDALCEGKVDAIIYMAGHPNGSIREVTSRCKTRLVPVTGKEIEKLIASNPFYDYSTIPAGMYPENPEATPTFGVKATLVTSENASTDTIYALVSTVFRHFDDFKTLHPVFASLNKEDMAQTGNSAPLHRGAMRYYKEAGLYKKK